MAVSNLLGYIYRPWVPTLTLLRCSVSSTSTKSFLVAPLPSLLRRAFWAATRLSTLARTPRLSPSFTPLACFWSLDTPRTTTSTSVRRRKRPTCDASISNLFFCRPPQEQRSLKPSLLEVST
ncbi:hypothetical protein CFIMG_000897RA [Ceratocystis fimbriata CBS 114723]|uniref:Uncharacterized protein n=1 Tax=Ceratocystis fimbriata CBS 114723 TaxID=1035309 RepID=A0A2C5X873_9PEZI|nr:hypothetical protein CFIMG_000897RA [Ceratocystis fimbriata CBS 114723]